MSTRKGIAVMHGIVAGAGGLPGQGITPVDIFSLFNIFVGLMVVSAIIAYAAGLITWMILLGTVGRSRGIRIMEWGVVILFVLVVLLAIVQFFVGHPAAATLAVSAVIAVFIGYIVLEVIKSSGGEEKEPARTERR
ncbi:MAG: hypothetical protein Q8R25_03120 [bacterium]|nr:hypothetical protein [bacterium]